MNRLTKLLRANRLTAFAVRFEDTRQRYLEAIEDRKRLIIESYEAGMQPGEIARKLECQASVVGNALTQAGYQYDGRKWKK